MDISQLNKALSRLINKAKLAENHDNIDGAIERWVKVSELALKASRNTNFSSSYRKMLMNKTEGILQHIKELKDIKNQPKPKKTRMKKPEIDEETREKIDKALSEPLPKTPKKLPKETPEISPKKSREIKPEEQQQGSEKTLKKPKKKHKKNNSNVNIIEDSEFKNLPDGIHEVKTSEDFEVITPFDEDLVKKRLNQDVDMSALQPQENRNNGKNDSESINSEKIKLDKEDQDGNVICFACGQENPPNAKKCKSCGVELK